MGTHIVDISGGNVVKKPSGNSSAMGYTKLDGHTRVRIADLNNCLDKILRLHKNPSSTKNHTSPPRFKEPKFKAYAGGQKSGVIIPTEHYPS